MRLTLCEMRSDSHHSQFVLKLTLKTDARVQALCALCSEDTGKAIWLSYYKFHKMVNQRQKLTRVN